MKVWIFILMSPAIYLLAFAYMKSVVHKKILCAIIALFLLMYFWAWYFVLG